MDAPQTRHAVAATLPRSVSDAGLLALPMLKQQAAPPMWRLHRDAGVAAQHMARLLARPCMPPSRQVLLPLRALLLLNPAAQ